MFTIRLGVTYPIVFRDGQLLLSFVKNCQQEKARSFNDVWSRGVERNCTLRIFVRNGLLSGIWVAFVFQQKVRRWLLSYLDLSYFFIKSQTMWQK